MTTRLAAKGSKSTLADFCRALKGCERYLLTCHVMPEGDAIGSMLAMDSLLRRIGKEVIIICEDAFPERLHCLSDKRWNRIDSVDRARIEFDALLTTDSPSLKRIGRVQELVRDETVIFNIDHHVSNKYFGHYNYVRPEAAATGEVVMDIFKALELPLTKQEAADLYVAVATDTGSFKYSNTTAESHRRASELLETGIDVERLNEDIYGVYSLKKIKLYSRLLKRVRTTASGAIAWAAMRQDDLKKSGATYEDSEGFIDFLRYMREVKVAFFLSELDGSKGTRVSFRAKGPYDVNSIATHFNGGGHKKASGCVIEMPLKKAERLVLNYLEKRLAQHGG
jgi:phosphoesterase RecJ-like protein